MQNIIPMLIDLKKELYRFEKAQQEDDVILDINLFENGIPKDLTGATIELIYVNANNTVANVTGDSVVISANNVKITCPRDCTRSAGAAKFQLKIISSNKQISTFPIGLVITPGVIQGQLVSQNLSTILEDLTAMNVTANETIESLSAWVATHGDIVNLDNRVTAAESQLTENQLKTLITDNPITTLTDAVDGIMTIDSVKGKTLKNAIPKINFLDTQATYSTTNTTNTVLIHQYIDSYVKTSTEYTFIFLINFKDKNLVNSYFQINGTRANGSSVSVLSYSLNNYTSGNLVKYKVTIPSDVNVIGQIFIGGYSGSITLLTGGYCMMLEGDWNNKATPIFFEGIKSTGEIEANKIAINSIGKNLLDTSKITKDVAIGWANGIEFSELNSFSTGFIPISSGQNYIANYFSQIMFYDKDKKYLGNGEKLQTATGIQYKLFKVPNDSQIKFLRLGVRSTYNSNLVMYNQNVQLEKGITETTYEQYKFDNLEVKLKEAHKGLLTTQDEMIGSKLIKRIGKAVLNGSESWTASSANTSDKINYVAFIKLDNHKLVSELLSDRFISVTVESFNSVFLNNITKLMAITYANGAVSFMVPKDMISTPDLAGFKAWLQSNPTTVYYELATPIEETLNIPSLKLFKNGSLYLNNGITPTVSLKYPSNINSRMETVESELDRAFDNIGGIWKSLLSLADRELRMKSITLLTTETNVDLKNKINEILNVWR